ncbi:MAG: hypothetical protein ACO3G4_14065 [Opitutaceae bacterium]
MKTTKALVSLLLLATGSVLHGAGEPAPKSSAKEALRARMAEGARAAAPVAPKVAPAPTPSASTPAAAAATPAATPAATEPTASTAESPALLPQVEVRKGKFSERDYRLAQELHQQDQAIERERRNLKTTETDRALNDAQVSRTLSIFGGNSAAFRQRVASERVELLEAEKDIIEQIAIAQQPEEKKALQRQLDELRALRRQLDQTLR